MPETENERQYRVLSQMLTMHASLRDRYKRRAFLLNTSLMVTSIALCAFVFASPDILATLGLTPTATQLGLGFASVLSLILSIVESRVNWESVSCRHGDAAKELSLLKAKFRGAYAETKGTNEKRNANLSRCYHRVTNSIVAIPDAQFISLKADHVYKTLLSQRISQYPKAPKWFLRMQLRVEGIRDAIKGVPENAKYLEKEGNDSRA